jgi:hypothetical protein
MGGCEVVNARTTQYLQYLIVTSYSTGICFVNQDSDIRDDSNCPRTLTYVS